MSRVSLLRICINIDELGVHCQRQAVKTLEEADWKRIAERESFGHGYELLYRTAMGRAFEVMGFIDKEEARLKRTPTAREIEDAWKEHVDQASSGGDRVNVTYVETLLKCRKRIFNDAAATQKLLWADDNWVQRSPWDSIYKIECLATKVGLRETSNEKLLWMIDFIHDRILSKVTEKGEFSCRILSGKGQPNNKGVLDLALFKLEASKHNLHVQLEALMGDREAKQAVRRHCDSYDAFRNAFGYPDGPAKAKPWLTLLPPNLQAMVQFHNELVFGLDFDGTLKLAMRASKSIDEVFKESSIASRLKEIADMCKEEGTDDVLATVVQACDCCPGVKQISLLRKSRPA